MDAAIIVERKQLLREALVRVVGGMQLKIAAAVTCMDEIDYEILIDASSVLIIIGLENRFELVFKQIAAHREMRPHHRIVVISDVDNTELAISALRAGAHAYVDERSTAEVLIDSLKVVLTGGSIIPSGVLARMLGEKGGPAAAINGVEGHVMRDASMTGGPQLSAREIVVLGCLVEGSPNKVIARKAQMAEATVKVHVKAILRKIQAKNRTQAAIWALNDGRSPLCRNRPAAVALAATPAAAAEEVGGGASGQAVSGTSGLGPMRLR